MEFVLKLKKWDGMGTGKNKRLKVNIHKK